MAWFKIKLDTYSHLKGRKEEELAANFLQKKGLKFVTSNYYSRFGEIDLIMYDDKTLVFVEVKSRKNQSLVSAIESITMKKMQKIRKTAQHYLIQFDSVPDCRFDVVAITTYSDTKNCDIDWIKNAF